MKTKEKNPRSAEKNVIFRQRKEMKKRSHQIVRSHYVVLLFVTLILMLFGTEYRYATLDTDKYTESTDADNPGNMFSAQEVRSDIMIGELQQGLEKSRELEQKIVEEADNTGALGRTNGILAQVVNGVSSGSLLARAAQSMHTVIHSGQAVGFIFIILSFLWYAVIYTFVKNVYSAIVRRLYLVARVYEKVPFADVLHFAAVRKWVNASLTMLIQSLFISLADLTVIGGILLRYFFFCIPFIVAENPSVKKIEAVKLSCRMMRGHKWEYFKYDLTLLGWRLIGFFSMGIVDALYGAPYRMACETEFYVRVREEALRSRIESWELLNDPYLYQKADKILLYETYFDVVDEITVLHENRIELTGVRKVVSDWFGIWLGGLEEKKQYDEQEGRQYAIRGYKDSMDGKTYPNWLNPLWRKKEISKKENFAFLRSYPIWVLFLLFISFCFIGWTWEVALHLMQTGEFANRGTLHGPWLPIYGAGGVIVMILCARFRKNPVAEFFSAVVLCGVLEYVSAWQLEMRYHQRWWSYDGYFLNLHGRICAEGLLVFGIGCCIVVYLVAPLFDLALSRVKKNILIWVCIVLGVIYGTDLIYSSGHPNMAKGAVEAVSEETEAPAEVGAETSAKAETEARAEAGAEAPEKAETEARAEVGTETPAKAETEARGGEEAKAPAGEEAEAAPRENTKVPGGAKT